MIKYGYHILIISLVFFNCSKESKNADLNIYIDTNQKIDSVFISNIGQDREFMMLPFENPIKVDLKDSINDLYNVWLYSEGKQFSSGTNQFWLKGDEIVIKARLDDTFIVDTVIGSDIYYKEKAFQKEYRALYKAKADSETINDYLITFTKDNVNNVLSLLSANVYMNANQNDQLKIRHLQEIIEVQPEAYKSHSFFNVHASIESMLSTKGIDPGNYNLVTVEGDETRISLEKEQLYLLDFWFINCAPCISDHKKFKKYPTLLKDNQIEMIGISIDESQEEWIEYLSKNDYSWANYREPRLEGSMRDDYLITIFPTYYLIKGDGSILQTFNGFSEIEDYLNQ